jgi:predicted nucleic acid-binding protein
VTAAVVDASIVSRWFWPPPDQASLAIRSDYEAGRIEAHAPTLLFLELLNVAGRRMRWGEEELMTFSDTLWRSRFVLGDPPLPAIATWVARDLTAYDAAYVALAEQLGVPLVTRDRAVLDVARGIAVGPDNFASSGS